MKAFVFVLNEPGHRPHLIVSSSKDVVVYEATKYLEGKVTDASCTFMSDLLRRLQAWDGQIQFFEPGVKVKRDDGFVILRTGNLSITPLEFR